MWIQRDLYQFIASSEGSFIQILIGPRQSGKSSLLSQLGQGKYSDVQFDDLQLRQFAQKDPALFLSQFSTPLNLDEVQYVPNLFPELKKRIDKIKKNNLFDGASKKIEVLYRLTGSNMILLSSEVRETLVGRAFYFHLNTLSVNEIRRSFPTITISEIIFKGGLPELYTNQLFSVITYLNDYIVNFVQKDIAHSAGIQKISEFNTVLGLLSARVGQLLNYSDIAKDAGVKSVTVREWVGILEQAELLYVLRPYESNLNKRLIKSPKIYFFDSGLVVRLQGHSELRPMLQGPYIGPLFENLVAGEILKFRQNFGKNWPLFYWRTKEGEEVDFILQVAPDNYLAFEVKWGISGGAVAFPKSLKEDFPSIKEIILIVPEGPEILLSPTCRQIPIGALATFLEKYF